MPTKYRDRQTELQEEISSLRTELDLIATWDSMFGARELNADSYLARQRRRWEIMLRIKELEEQLRAINYRRILL